MLLASRSHPHLWWYLRCSGREEHDISDTRMWSKLSLSSMLPSLLSLSLFLIHTHTHWAASKLRCAHGRAGTWKTKANMQAYFWLERITRFTQPSVSCSEKANVEWNGIMCTPEKNVKLAVDAHRGAYVSKQMITWWWIKKNVRGLMGTIFLHWWKVLSRWCFSIFICPELGVCERLLAPCWLRADLQSPLFSTY